MRADHLLPDDVSQINHRGATIRKGTVGAFLINARVWLDSGADESARVNAAADIIEALPALRALGLFDLLEIRDAGLRAWIDAQTTDAPVGEVRQ
jgi:hypothetical protein